MDWSSFARGLGAWALVGASIAYALGLVRVAELTAFVGKNTLGRDARTGLIMSLAAGGAAAVAAAGRAYFMPEARGGVLWSGRVALPLAFLGPLVLLLQSSSLELFPRVVAMAACVLAFEASLRVSLRELAESAPRRARAARDVVLEALARLEHARLGRFPLVAVLAVLLAVGYAGYVAYFSVLRHHHFATMSNDLGQYDNFFYNALHGRPFKSTPLVHAGSWSALRSHAEFSMYALLPFYALYPHAETLLVLQAALLGSAGVAIYRLGARRLSRLSGLVLLLAYLFYAPLHGANFYDLHFQPIGAAFALWAFDCLDAKKPWAFAVAFILALTSREDVALLFIAAGGYLLLSGRAPRAGLGLALVSAVYFGVVKFVVMPHFGTWWYANIYKELFPAGNETYGGVVQTLLSNPLFAFSKLVTEKKLGYALQILVPLAFLPLRGRFLWLSVLPGSVVTLMTTAYNPTVEINFQYSAYLIALIFPASVLSLQALGGAGTERRPAALGALLLGTLLTTAAWGAIPPRAHFRAGYTDVDFGPVSASKQKKRRELRELAALVPPKASLAVSEHELPHVSGRSNCYDLKDDDGDADYLLYEKDSGGDGATNAKKGLKEGRYAREAERGSLVLLKKTKRQDAE